MKKDKAKFGVSFNDEISFSSLRKILAIDLVRDFQSVESISRHSARIRGINND